jgi:hypothetical protein
MEFKKDDPCKLQKSSFDLRLTLFTCVYFRGYTSNRVALFQFISDYFFSI